MIFVNPSQVEGLFKYQFRQKRTKYQNFKSDFFFIVYQFFIVFTATLSGGISLIIMFQLVNTLVYMWLQIRNNHKLFRYFTHQFSEDQSPLVDVIVRVTKLTV